MDHCCFLLIMRSTKNLVFIRTSLYRNDSTVTEDNEKQEEECHITKALSDWSYLKRDVNKVKHDRMNSKLNKTTTEKTTSDNKSRHFVVVPYIAGLTTERVS